MKIELKELTIRDLAKGYVNNAEGGAEGFDGMLNIRPAYQREFVYKDAQRDRVIDTVRKGFPLNVMYWVKNSARKGNVPGIDDALSSIGPENEYDYEVLDGQQRTISICEYVTKTFSIGAMYFDNLTEDQREQILNYRLMVYFCEGTDSEKLDWFRTINIAGEKLTDQELRNAVYTGTWLASAKKWFSKTGGPAYQIAHEYVQGSANRQEYLETALRWISDGNIEQYMAVHQHEDNADDLLLYFKAVIAWVGLKFPVYRREMKSVDWGALYNQHKDDALDANVLEKEVSRLMADEDVTTKKGIYAYVLNGSERTLSIRTFTDNMKREAFERQKGVCPHCKKQFQLSEMEGDHISPWSKGGRTTAVNCQLLCTPCNRKKSNR